jgi:hypothetical protein
MESRVYSVTGYGVLSEFDIKIAKQKGYLNETGF